MKYRMIPSATTPNPWGLSEKHIRVLRCLVQFGEDKFIQRELGIERSTVNHYIRTSKAALGVDSRVALAIKYDRWVRQQEVQQ